MFLLLLESKAMANSLGSVLFLVAIRCLLDEVAGQCQSDGFIGCECNIMRACDANGKPQPGLDDKLTGYAPSGLQQFGRFAQGGKQNLAYLCEQGVVAILYDSENRAPLYAATVMDKEQLYAAYKRPRSEDFTWSSSLDLNYQQKDTDYHGSSNVKICYKQQPESAADLIDCQWYKALNLGKTIPPLTTCTLQNIDFNDIMATGIHKGHLIASAYGRGNIDRIKATFAYTNSIPQFGGVNSGLWRVMEQALVMKWGREKLREI